MLGAIAGDIIGSVYEFDNIKTTEFPLFRQDCFFTDDTVMTVAVACSILYKVDYVTAFKDFGQQYPNAGYGGRFRHWLTSENTQPYNSWGNGSAMRVSPVGFAFDTLQDVLDEALRSAEVTHNHPEGIKGAQATAGAIFLARTGKSKKEIRNFVTENFAYNLNRTCDEIRPVYKFNETCQETVPEAIIVFLESNDFEHAMRLAVSLGGDTDTLSCITGGIAEAFYGGVPEEIVREAKSRLTPDLLEIVEDFYKTYRLK